MEEEKESTDGLEISTTMPNVGGPGVAQAGSKSFVGHAKLIGALTLVSRIFGLGREIAQATYFGTGLVAGAFRVAFVVPNLFRKLFGEGALAAAFIPLYVQAVKGESEEQAERFAASAVTLLVICLGVITVVGEGIVWGMILLAGKEARADWLLTLKLTSIVLPYVLLICGTAFLSAILQVHKRFGVPAFTPVILNAVHIGVMVSGGWLLHLNQKGLETGEIVRRQTVLAYWLAGFVLVAGVMQVLVLQPALKKVGFRLRMVRAFWTPGIKKMAVLSLPVAMGAGVLQLSVMMDKGIATVLAQPLDKAGHVVATHFMLFGHWMRYPMKAGAISRLDLAQFLYQFPLGVFAIALATAIFPSLSADAVDKDRGKFRGALRHGIEMSLFEGFAASAGLIIVRYPAIRLLFRHGYLPAEDVPLIANSLMFYAAAIWAFSLLQIVNRAYYALHDTRTPFVMAVVNIVVNLVVEVPLCWTGLGESAMAVGTMVSFAVQAVVMLWMLDQRVGGLELGKTVKSVGKMLVAVGMMCGVCWGVRWLPGYPRGAGKVASAIQLAVMMGVGAGMYLGVSWGLGVEGLRGMVGRKSLK